MAILTIGRRNSMTDADKYDAVWRLYVARRKLANYLLAVALFLTALWQFATFVDVASYWLFIFCSWVPFAAARLAVASSIRCPRCDLRFFRRRFFGNPFATRCRHCGLLLFAIPSTSRSFTGP